MRMTKQEQIDMARAWQQQQMMNNGCGTPFYAIIIVAVIMMFSSCATKTKIEYRDRIVDHYNTIVQHDTLREHTSDSIFEKIYVKGDTVYNTKYVEKTRWRDRIVERHDTCWRDSVVTEYKETTKEVTKIPKLFWISMCFSILCLIFAFIKLIRWLQIR
jgi:hypothetical protein